MREFLDSREDGPSQNYYYRMLALGCFDIFTMLPIGVTQLASSIISEERLQFYQGWANVHSHMDPFFVTKSMWSTEKWDVFTVHWNDWIYPFLALAFFCLFGLTPSAISGYRRFFHIFARKLGAKQKVSVEEELPEAAFKSGRGTNATIMSSTSSKWVSSISYVESFHIDNIYCSPQPNSLA